MPRVLTSSIARITLVWMVLPASFAAEVESDLQRQIDDLRAHYEERVQALEERVEELERQLERSRPESAPDELAQLRAAAAAAAEATPSVSPPPPADEPALGHERNLNRLNPEISFTGDILALTSGGEHDFDDREFELDLQASLDPFSSTKWTLAFSAEEGVEVEEGYIRYSGIAKGLTLRAGKMRQTFGVLNRYHLHALPQVDYPTVLLEYLGEEGLVQTGLSAEWLLPAAWASTSELTFQVTDGSGDPFGGEHFDELVGLAHLKSFWDLSPGTYLEWGLSGAVGSPSPGQDTRLWGTDLTLHWQPPARAKYRELTWRTEVLLSRRDDALAEDLEAMGGYSYLEGLVARNLSLGLRYDWWEDPITPEDEYWALEPYLTWWQSEYVRFRATYRFLKDEQLGSSTDGFVLQLTWAAGPHKHESY